MSPLCVLVIDDDADTAISVTRLLRLYGFRAIACDSATEILEAVERERPDAAICDLAMPAVNGFELARLIRGTPRGAAMRLIALTGLSRQVDRDAAKQAGFDRVVLKPSSIEELIEVLSADARNVRAIRRDNAEAAPV